MAEVEKLEKFDTFSGKKCRFEMELLLRRQPQSQDTINICPICHEATGNFRDFVSHMAEHQRSAKVESAPAPAPFRHKKLTATTTTKPEDKQYVYKCALCVHNYNKIRAHKDKKVDLPELDDFSDFTQAKVSSNKAQSVHQGQLYKCEACNKDWQTVDEYLEHANQWHIDQEIKLESAVPKEEANVVVEEKECPTSSSLLQFLTLYLANSSSSSSSLTNTLSRFSDFVQLMMLIKSNGASTTPADDQQQRELVMIKQLLSRDEDQEQDSYAYPVKRLLPPDVVAKLDDRKVAGICHYCLQEFPDEMAVLRHQMETHRLDEEHQIASKTPKLLS
ncbi:hypothetical protein Ciccas_011365 [Cichlidogyrus casuarinus]|uniref:C2H2-type domain-containing protein n=1 Tax=Cichlidogyrus casuarinus TaxID=1844966 RepID=A0ABD2PS96_9PLAT